MKLVILGILTFILGTIIWAAIASKRAEQDQIYDQRQISNQTFKIRITAFKEKGVALPGIYIVLQSATGESDEWRNIQTVRGDEPIPIRPDQLGFVNHRIGYAFVGSYYLITTDGGINWSIWNGEKQVPARSREQYNLSPYIETIQLQPDGTGVMRLYRYFTNREQGPDFFTLDYGVHWSLKE